MTRYLILLFLLYGCASQSTLSGGDKDETPPQVIQTWPDSASLQIESQIFRFEFDEYIQTTNASQLLIISPSQVKPPTLKIKGKKLYIELNDSLKKNTTYTVQFNGAISDINESNPLENYRYIISTGTFIDSLEYSGIVLKTEDKSPCETCKVLLYSNHKDSVVLLEKPDYVAFTDASGRFRFQNLPDNRFQVYAILDENKNITLDDNESISMPLLRSPSDSTGDTLYIFPYQAPKRISISQLKPKIPGVHRYYITQPIHPDSMAFTIDDSLANFTYNFSRDTITVYHLVTHDSTRFEFKVDSSSYEFYRSKGSDKAYRVKIGASLSTLGIKINTPFWIDTFDINSEIRLIQDSAEIPYNIVDLQKHSIELGCKRLDDKELTVIVPKATVTDIQGQHNTGDTLHIYPAMEGMPTLNLIVEISDDQDHILKLMKGQIILDQRIIDSTQTISYPKLEPGEYHVILIQDSNKDHQWTTGDPFTGTLPEPIKTSATFEMRLNWDKELIINIL